MGKKKTYPLLVVSTTGSINWNKEYKMYFCPEDRNMNQPFEYLGFYGDKSIRGMGKVENCIVADHVNGGLRVRKFENPVTESQEKRVLQAFTDGKMAGHDDKYQGYKFYIIDENDFTEMNFCKLSSGGLRGFQYLNLRDYFGSKRPKDDSSQAIVELLEGKTWS
ncbi:hypothetical protein P0082_01880 [Candidatus Haliotispira prima]|uniref:Uncharacterized protein n=1 Tax=Candidatus Haliotispira prima TaxID=3034016 RepID=A0ABY8MI15_9SPIO|nr:hypothetical protein P0082_01880 [Candidatus Haliotispira prima]